MAQRAMVRACRPLLVALFLCASCGGSSGSDKSTVPPTPTATPVCFPNQSLCTNNADCCGTQCNGGVCCLNNGWACDDDRQCCNPNGCVSGTCEPKCTPNGVECYADQDCCNKPCRTLIQIIDGYALPTLFKVCDCVPKGGGCYGDPENNCCNSGVCSIDDACP
jgi:hypothetical protein